MKLGIMQPYFFPYIGYYQLINYVDNYVIYDDVNFIKGGWINRNKILCNGVPTYINVPMKGASPNKLISEVEVSPDMIARGKLLRTLQENYGRAPFFDKVYLLLKSLIEDTETNLAIYLEQTLRGVCNYLGIHTNIIRSSDIPKDNTLRGQEKVLEICHLLHANVYCNAIGGMQLYNKDTFKNMGVDLQFLQGKISKYPQYKDEFIPSLSIIDIMMFCSPTEIQNMLKDFVIL